jgi:NDP-sugar pyrophosphorylase family protein
MEHFPIPRQAVIMAAGLGTRLRPLTETTPKPMLYVAGRPLLEHTIDRLPAEVTDVVLVVGYLREQIAEHFGSDWHGRRIHYAVQETMDGTAMAAHVARPKLLPGRFFVLNGDDLYATADLETLGGYEHAMLVIPRETQGRFSCMCGDDGDTLTSITEACVVSHAHCINAGAYVLDHGYFDLPPAAIGKGEFGLPHTLAAMLAYPVTLVRGTAWFPIGFPEDIPKATALIEEGGI